MSIMSQIQQVPPQTSADGERLKIVMFECENYWEMAQRLWHTACNKTEQVPLESLEYHSRPI